MSSPEAELAVKPASSSDLPELLRLIRELADYERLSDEVVASEEVLGSSLFGARPAAEAVIGCLDGQTEGFAVFFENFSTFIGRRGLYLEDLFVRPEVRGRGLGQALFRYVAREAVRRGCGRFEWAVLDWNSPAIAFYRKLGAVPMEDWTTYRLTGEALRTAAAGGTS